MSKLKVALLTATTTLSALMLGGCFGGGLEGVFTRAMQYVTVGNIFD
jgi:hypothetical protein